MVTFKEFKIEELFDIHPTSAYKLTDSQLIDVDGKTPVLSNKSVTNGIKGYSKLKPTEKGNMITFSDTTTDCAIFYQPFDFIGYPHVQGLYSINNTKWTERSLLYFLTLFKKCANGRFDYATKFTRTIASKMVVSLPILANGNIDIEYMERYIAKLEDEYYDRIYGYIQKHKYTK